MGKSMENSEIDRVRNGRRVHDLCASITREAMKRTQTKLLEMGLSMGAYNLLRALDGRTDMTIAEVCKVLRVESATVSTLVVRMERDGLIQKEQSPHDKRASILKPTDRATGLARQADQLMAIEAADITHRLAAGEQAQLIALLERVLGNLSTAYGS